ncbi:MAG TPA: hypothetical protein PKY78_00170 [Candidatus Omnitrophota bacterium]|nr:hypothetical protein [Candidatus Omnitrophota bacterium]
MRKKNILKSLFVSALVIFSGASFSFCQEYKHIEQMFDLRTAITNQGKMLPENIKQTVGNDLRTLERIFELNTSTLTTIEAYFRLFKMAISQEGDPTQTSVNILNEWLAFIKNQCAYDTQYLDEAMKEIKNPAVLDHIKTAKTNIEQLAHISELGIKENPSMIGGTE